MRLVRSLFIYFAVVFLGGALAAPWLYWGAHGLAGALPSLEKLVSSPFSRYVNRSLLGMALLGLWPLLRSCQMLKSREMGLKTGNQPLLAIAFGFLLGFGSLALVASVVILTGGRSFDATHSASQIMAHIFSAGLTAVIVSFLEELLFRGALFGILRKVQPWPAALVLSSAVYALAHFIQKTDSPAPVTWLSGLELLPKIFHAGPHFIPAVLALFMAGSTLALAYQRTGTLFFSMGLHSGWIFWLKFYGFLTVSATAANPAIWGTEKLVDGWVAFPVLCGVFSFVWIMRIPGAKSNGA